MAFTVGILSKVSVGNQRCHAISASVDSASGNIVTGLKNVDFFVVAPISMATAAIVMKKNVGSGATSVPGTININGAASGDVFHVLAYGK